MKIDNQEKDIGFSIVVPCYNEEKNIPILVQRFRETISSNNIKIVLVNNGSTDESENIIIVGTILTLYFFFAAGHLVISAL